MNAPSDVLQVGPWRAERMTGRLVGADGTRELEPKVMDLLFLLGARRGEVVAREEILAALWPGVTVGEDALSRTVFKLRKGLDDDPKSPRFVETLPKRGYRLLTDGLDEAPAVARRRPLPLWAAGLVAAGVVVGAGGLIWRASAPPSTSEITRRADDAYFQYTRADNEAAVVLYERALAANPKDADALAGLANALVQRVIRWPDGARSPSVVRTDVRTTLASGRARTPEAVKTLARAQSLAEQAVALAPRNPTALRSLGLVLSVEGRLEEAREVYERALGVDPNAWGVLINLAEVHDLTGRPDQGMAALQQAYGAMSKAYDRQSARIRPWHAALGVLIGDRYRGAGDGAQAEAWYRRVLAEAPLDAGATAGLAAVLRARSAAAEAARLCADLQARAGRGC